MSKTGIPVRELAIAWRQDPGFQAEYAALEDEFSQASASLEAEARGDAPLASSPSPPERSSPSPATQRQ